MDELFNLRNKLLHFLKSADHSHLTNHPSNQSHPLNSHWNKLTDKEKKNHPSNPGHEKHDWWKKLSPDAQQKYLQKHKTDLTKQPSAPKKKLKQQGTPGNLKNIKDQLHKVINKSEETSKQSPEENLEDNSLFHKKLKMMFADEMKKIPQSNRMTPKMKAVQTKMNKIISARFQKKFNIKVSGFTHDTLKTVENCETLYDKLPPDWTKNNKFFNNLNFQRDAERTSKNYTAYHQDDNIVITNSIKGELPLNINEFDGKFVATMIHEIGHSLWEQMPEEKLMEWAQMNGFKDLTGSDKSTIQKKVDPKKYGISGYSDVNPGEAFSEYVAYYMIHKKEIEEKLESKNPSEKLPFHEHGEEFSGNAKTHNINEAERAIKVFNKEKSDEKRKLFEKNNKVWKELHKESSNKTEEITNFFKKNKIPQKLKDNVSAPSTLIKKMEKSKSLKHLVPEAKKLESELRDISIQKLNLSKVKMDVDVLDFNNPFVEKNVLNNPWETGLRGRHFNIFEKKVDLKNHKDRLKWIKENVIDKSVKKSFKLF